MPIMTAYEQPSLPRWKERVSTHRKRKRARERERERRVKREEEGEREREREREREKEKRNTWYNHAALKPHIATMATERRIVVIVIVGGCAPE